LSRRISQRSAGARVLSKNPSGKIMTSKLAERISAIPKLYEAGDKSTASLLKDTGYPERREPVTVEDVENVLKREPALIDLWLKRCQDQRLVGGWGIEHEAGAYRVQSFSSGRSLVVRDRLRACAEFVVRYVSFIGETLTRTR
jgi:hypothetical protein